MDERCYLPPDTQKVARISHFDFPINQLPLARKLCLPHYQ
ncbi:hypothetical protein [Sulfolobus spindle-shaped virus]|nr:hypothetical protein [Sulfolobus spindle-shaped virus]AZG03256.1 hypothetical protein [Sulfolobus spindle-shaped virus]